MKISLKHPQIEFEVALRVGHDTRQWLNEHGGWWLAAMWRMHYPWGIQFTEASYQDRAICDDDDGPAPLYIANPEGKGLTTERRGALRFKTQLAAKRFMHYSDRYTPVHF